MEIFQCTIIRRGRKLYHMQVAYDRGIVRRINLDSAETLEQAQRIALAKGYDVEHWMHAGDEHVMEIR